MSDIFIAYSRKNVDFTRKLHDDLVKRGWELWIDWIDIPLSENWRKEIESGILNANIFMFILSPDSIRSEQCNQEVDLAVKFNKRILPVLIQQIDNDDDKAFIHPELMYLNWFFFREYVETYENKLEQLVEMIGSSSEYLRLHTEYLRRATDWSEKYNRDNAYLLQGIVLKQAEAWLGVARDNEPTATMLHEEFIQASLNYQNQLVFRLRHLRQTIPRQLGIAQDRKIFISYRRSDSQHITDRIYDKLSSNYRDNDLFMDIFSIDLGVNFAKAIETTLAECAVVLVVMGDTWAKVRDKKTNQLRLFDEEDFVRKEVEYALRNPEITVLPLLVSGASMPTFSELPKSMSDLAQMKGYEIRPGHDFHDDMRSIISEIRKARRSSASLANFSFVREQSEQQSM